VKGNGLRAATYVAVADLDPALADEVLALLARKGVAAYAVPTPPGERSLTPQGGDRLYVDTTAASRVRPLLAAHLTDAGTELRAPGGDLSGSAGPDSERWPSPPGAGAPPPHEDDLDVDAAFAQIVAGFAASAAEPTASLDDAAGAPSAPPPASPEPGRRAAGEWDDVVARTPAPAPEPEEEGFVPEVPPPISDTDLVTRLAWVALLAGPLVLFAAVLLGRQLAGWQVLVATASFVGGFVTLAARQRHNGDDDDDNGAVV